EGTVFFVSAQDRRDLSATPGVAQVAEIDATGHFEIHAESTHAGPWAWVPEASRGFVTEGRSVDAYLRWLADEQGYALAYRSPASEAQAKRGLLPGDLGALPPQAAVAAIGSITDLDVALDDSTISVASKRERDADPGHDRQ